MAEVQEGVKEPETQIGDNMTAGERFDTTFGSNDPTRRENTIGQEPQQAAPITESLGDKVKKFLGIGQRQ